jgi:hypothetical protein
MKSLIALASLTLAVLTKPGASGPSRAPPPLAHLPMLPSIARVKLEVRGASLVVIQEVTLPRGEWKGETLDFHVAFGAPGPPRAIDAHLVPIDDGALEADEGVVGDVLAFDRVPRRPASAHALLGRDQMAGIVVHLPRESLAAAFTPGNMAALRLRSALDLPDLDPQGGRSVVVRLGASEGTPLTLGRLTISAGAPGATRIVRAEARLCGQEADPRPLAISPRTSAGERPIAPVLAVRHATDDLCIRFWMT